MLPRLASRFATNFFSTSQFFEDAERGKLPTSSFIEPQIIGWNHNDMHRARLDRLSHHISPRELGLTPDQIFDTNDDAVRALAPAGS